MKKPVSRHVRSFGLIALGVMLGAFFGLFGPNVGLVTVAAGFFAMMLAAGWVYVCREPAAPRMTQVYPGVFSDAALDQQHAKEIERLRNLPKD